MLGSSDKHCVLTLVDRKTDYLMPGKLSARTAEATSRRALARDRESRARSGPGRYSRRRKCRSVEVHGEALASVS